MPKKSAPFLMLLILASMVWASASSGRNKGMTPKAILSKMAHTYATAQTYQDSGEVIHENKRTTSFRTYFARPRSFRFEHVDYTMGKRAEKPQVIWSNGEQTYSLFGWVNPRVKEHKDMTMAVAAATGVSRGSAYTVLSLLNSGVGGHRLTELSRLSLIGREKFEGKDCYVIQGYSRSHLTKLWIAVDDFMLRKLLVKDAYYDGTDQVEIRRDIKLNGKVLAEIFNYSPE